MNIETGREFSFTNPQDDPQLYPQLPHGFRYDVYGNVINIPNLQDQVNELRNDIRLLQDQIAELIRRL